MNLIDKSPVSFYHFDPFRRGSSLNRKTKPLVDSHFYYFSPSDCLERFSPDPQKLTILQRTKIPRQSHLEVEGFSM